jgi:hypothetical protein
MTFETDEDGYDARRGRIESWRRRVNQAESLGDVVELHTPTGTVRVPSVLYIATGVAERVESIRAGHLNCECSDREFPYGVICNRPDGRWTCSACGKDYEAPNGLGIGVPQSQLVR